jgi:hypothetical protein
MSGQMKAVVVPVTLDEEPEPATKKEPSAPPRLESVRDLPTSLTEEERATAKARSASTFDRLVDVNIDLTKAVRRLIFVSCLVQGTQLVMLLMTYFTLRR